jgi:hypothetical protein
VVVTNSHGIKTSLARYSDNILTVNPSIESLKDAIGAGARLASNEALRFSNYSRNRLLRSWRPALEDTVQRLTSMFQGKAI